MPENELLLWGTLAMIAGGALFAGIMKVPAWKGAVIVLAGLALCAVATLAFGAISHLASLAIFVVGAAITGSAMSLGGRATGWSITGSIIGAFVVGFLVPLFGAAV